MIRVPRTLRLLLATFSDSLDQRPGIAAANSGALMS